jgi:hypothetical protein
MFRDFTVFIHRAQFSHHTVVQYQKKDIVVIERNNPNAGFLPGKFCGYPVEFSHLFHKTDQPISVRGRAIPGKRRAGVNLIPQISKQASIINGALVP